MKLVEKINIINDAEKRNNERWNSNRMTGKYTESQKKASLKYQSGMSQIKITVSKPLAETYREWAKAHNITLTEMIITALEEYMKTK